MPRQRAADAAAHARGRHEESRDHELAPLLQAQQADSRAPLLCDPEAFAEQVIDGFVLRR
ncbi:MAG: hypothetical protein QOF69_1837 [Solirubrobacteraceae bacterium]|nr:hypothetical protein [Solirubrobacteraceae bacterium]